MRKVVIGRILLALAAPAWIQACGDEPATTNPGAQEVSALSQAQIKLRLGLQMYQVNRFGEAIGLFEQTLTQDPTNYDARYWRAAALMQLNRNADALTEFDRLLAEHPGEYSLQLMRASVMTDLGREAEALVEFERLLAIQAKDPELMVNRGIALQKLGRGVEALASVDRGLTLFGVDPSQARAQGGLLATNVLNGHLARASILIDAGRYDDALQALDHAKLLETNRRDPSLLRIKCLTLLGRAAEADALRDELLRMYPNDPGWETALDQARTP